jgi:hypothetical protein
LAVVATKFYEGDLGMGPGDRKGRTSTVKHNLGNVCMVREKAWQGRGDIIPKLQKGAPSKKRA